MVVDPAEDGFGLAELAGLLQVEDLAVAVGIGEAEGLGEDDGAGPWSGSGEREAVSAPRAPPSSLGRSVGTEVCALGAGDRRGEADACRDQKWSQIPCPPPARPEAFHQFSNHDRAYLRGKPRGGQPYLYDKPYHI